MTFTLTLAVELALSALLAATLVYCVVARTPPARPCATARRDESDHRRAQRLARHRRRLAARAAGRGGNGRRSAGPQARHARARPSTNCRSSPRPASASPAAWSAASIRKRRRAPRRSTNLPSGSVMDARRAEGRKMKSFQAFASAAVIAAGPHAPGAERHRHRARAPMRKARRSLSAAASTRCGAAPRRTSPATTPTPAAPPKSTC